MTACSMCGGPVHHAGLTEHPCCAQARNRGETSCYGCETAKRRLFRGGSTPATTQPTPPEPVWSPVWWIDGAPQRFAPTWPGRAFAFEVGPRAYTAAILARRRYSPRSSR